MLIKYKFSGLLNAVKLYGGYGAYCYLLIVISKSGLLKGRLATIKLKNIQHPFYLRFGTTDFELLRDIFFWGEYDIKIKFIPKTIIDGGANIGLTSIILSNRYPEAEIIAVEPESANYLLLEKNAKGYKNIRLVKAAVWYKPSFLIVKKSPLGEFAFTVEETDTPGSDSIKGVSIANLIKEAGWEGADLVKLDIEGSEKEVFSNDPDAWISTTRVIITETHDWIKPGCSQAVETATKKYDFSVTNKLENTIYSR